MNLPATNYEHPHGALARREGEAFHRLWFETNPHPVWLYELETLRFLLVNDAAVAHYGWSREEFLGMTLAEIGPPEEVAATRRAGPGAGEAAEGLAASGIRRHRTRDGRLISVQVSSHSLEIDGRAARWVLAHDVTERVAAEASIRELNATLERLVAERTAQVAAKTQEVESFCYAVSHDLKAPLRGIEGYSRLLLEEYQDKLDADGQRFLQNICRATSQMTQLIDDLLAYSKMERRELQIGPLQLEAVVTGQLARRKEDFAGVELKVETKGLWVLADPGGLAVALRQVLDNALKFSKDARPRRVEIRATAKDGRGVIAIQDNGAGFDLRFEEKIFEVFQRLHRAEDYPGTGMGLALVRKVMERMEGRVWAESAPGTGATFFLELPLAPAPAEARPPT